jgi:geranylgeranyl pyrophosphate synthase/predicted secreted hydrolase
MQTVSAKATKKEKNTIEFFAADWPQAGNIDLNIHDLPHHSSTTEWWYLNTHLKSKGGKEYSLFASFFRIIISYDEKTKKADYGHSVLWALTDVENKTYKTVSLVDKRAPKLGIEKINRGEAMKDPFIKRAALEMLKKGVVPYPDELLKDDAKIAFDKLHLNYDNNIFKKEKDGSYTLQLKHEEHQIATTLNFKPKKKAIRHGDNGVVRGIASEDMFYYFIPRCEVKGTLKIGKEKSEVTGEGWYDHEFGCPPPAKKTDKAETNKDDVSWNWIAMQLNNGWELTAYDLINNKTKSKEGSLAILIDPKGNRYQTPKFSFTILGEPWASTRTFTEYPTAWKIEVPEFGLKMEAVAAFPHQEFATVISKPAFWEGRMHLNGTMKGKKVLGKGYLERHGFIHNENMKDFLKAVSKQTLKSVERIIPLSFGQEKFEELVSRKGNKTYVADLDKEAYVNTFLKPIREVTDRSGKSWRSYATIACCDVVGGNSQNAIDWLALPEMMHVGSLMVDDVQDRSEVRRGGPSAHTVHGEATAINSGTACYFLGQICIYEAKDNIEKKIQIYNWYFETMRASHSGQAMDIYGLDYMMPQVLKDDATAKLLAKRVLATHRLKSAAPASYLARIGALLGDGTPEQIEGLGNFYEALGISFQIIDDTLNLKGFKDHLKTKGEDITAGKITYPIAKAMGLMPKADRKKLWDIVSAKTTNIEEIGKAVALLDKYNAIELCEQEAKQILERAWKKLDPLVRDSMVKLNLRAFCWFVLERTY